MAKWVNDGNCCLIKTLTIRFDVTALDERAIENLTAALAVQGEGIATFDVEAPFCQSIVDAQVISITVQYEDAT